MHVLQRSIGAYPEGVRGKGVIDQVEAKQCKAKRPLEPALSEGRIG